jgi:Aldehyde oxidase and xanthine dehydrogenase, a/b hammerhead domain
MRRALAAGPMMEFGPSLRFPLKDDRVLHIGQHVAIVVAETAQQARAAARLVEVEYAPTAPILAIDDPGRRSCAISGVWRWSAAMSRPRSRPPRSYTTKRHDE